MLSSPDDPLFAAQCWEVVYVLQTGKTVPISPRLLSYYSPPVTVLKERPPSADVPPYAVLEAGNDLVVVVSGVQNAQQFLDIYLGSLLPSPVKGQGKVNDGVLSKAEAIYADLGEQLLSFGGDVHLVGYSLGGAIVEVLWAMLLSGGRERASLSLLTWASPRPGDSAFRDSLQSAGRRWFRLDDPVPYFPPHTDESVTGPATVALSWVSGYDRYCHPLPGFSLYPDGSFVERAIPRGPIPDAAARLVQWATYIPPASNDHTLAAYLPDVARLVTVTPKPLPVRKRSITVVELTPFKGELVPPAFDVPDFQALLKSTVEVSEVAAYIPPKFRAKAQKYSGSKWSVQWLTLWVIEPDSRSHAKAVAKWINKLTRIMGTNVATRGNSFIQAFTNFLSAAEDGANGFIPPWVVNTN